MDLFEYQAEQSKRLVPQNYMSNLEWETYNFLTMYCLGKENAISMNELSEKLVIGDKQLRDIVANLRAKQNAKIVGDDNGYYIASKEEFETYITSRLKRTLSSIKTTLDLDPSVKNIIYWFLNNYENEGVTDGQTQMKFNGWERDFIRKYKEDYMKK
jgi:hypothetical protein